MPRSKIFWFPGATYHITVRGNRRKDIFKEIEDYEMYLKVLQETIEKFPFQLYCYCLMTNHVHLEIKTKQDEISKIMKRINQIYARYINNKYKYTGHLFQGRYYWKFIRDDKQIVDTSRYIHRNPIEAKIVKYPEKYRWSSYPMYIGKNREKIIFSDQILSYFNNNRSEYKKFVEVAKE